MAINGIRGILDWMRDTGCLDGLVQSKLNKLYTNKELDVYDMYEI